MVRMKARPNRLPAADSLEGRRRLAAMRGEVTAGGWTGDRPRCDVCCELQTEELVLWCPTCRRHVHPSCQQERPVGEIWKTGGPWWVCADCARCAAVEEQLTGRCSHVHLLENAPPPTDTNGRPDTDGRPDVSGLKRNRFWQDCRASRPDDSDDSRPPGPDDLDDTHPYKRHAVDPTLHASM